MIQAKTITQHLLTAQDRPGEWPAVRFKRHKSWLSLNWKDYYRSCEAAGLGLASLGVAKGDKVAILCQTRWEWAALDFGIMGLGAITIPIYPSNKADEVEFILNHSEAKILIVEDAAQLRKWESISRRVKSVTGVICIQPPQDIAVPVLSWDDFLEKGLTRFKDEPSFFASRIAETQLTDPATIVYTSGTTGEPKGALLTHEQIISEIEDVAKAFPISPADSTLTFLPYAHVLGRVELWLHTYSGFTLCFAESIERMRTNLREIKPTVLIGVPRIFEKIYADLLTQIEGHRVRKLIFGFVRGESIIQRQLGDWLIYSRMRQALGGRLRFVVSGGAALDAGIARFFYQAGLLILEGYGLTETTAAITTNRPDDFRFGTVGKPLADVRIRLADDGEILVRSQKVMKSYYKDPESTTLAMNDGYFATGDVGHLTEDGFLQITDRKKDLIKTAGGKYVAPQKLESLLKQDPLIANVLIHGESKKYVVALITLNPAYAKALAKEKGWNYQNYKSLTALPEMREAVRKVVANANADLASFETIKNFAILSEDFSIEKGELTPSLKVKRRTCDERYRETVERLY